jgi:nucleotide-binding universal stress UspA family protein
MNFGVGLKTIVVATDLDGHSEAALEYARKIAGAYGARIVLAYGLDPLDYAAVDAIPGALLSDLPEEARAALSNMSQELSREGIHSHSELRQGSVVQTLLDVAKQYDAGLIVVGSAGRASAGAIAVAAIAEELVRRADYPVLAVAADRNAGPFRPTPGGPVLFAMERNEATAAGLAAAVSLAESFQRALFVVHARTAAEESANLNPCEVALEEFGVRPAKSVEIHCFVRDGQPMNVIAEAIAEYRPSILVVGAKRASESGGSHGTAFSLLARARVPVLCVPAAALPSVGREAALPAFAH